MKLELALRHIQTHNDRMNAAFGSTVFDERVVLALQGNRAAVLDYAGPRADSFAKALLNDASLLCDAMEGRNYAPGDFEFVQNAQGNSFDAAVKLGEGIYLLCNHTEGSMVELRMRPLWREAQKPFVFLCEKFHGDPVELEAAPSPLGGAA